MDAPKTPSADHSKEPSTLKNPNAELGAELLEAEAEAEVLEAEATKSAVASSAAPAAAAGAGKEKPDPRLGTSIGKFRITQTLGRGAMGVVYLAEDTVLKRRVAIKFLPEEVAGSDPTTRERFLVEAQSAAGIQHNNVVAVFEAGQHEGLPYMVMELVTGGSVDRLLKQKRSFRPPRRPRSCSTPRPGSPPPTTPACCTATSSRPT